MGAWGHSYFENDSVLDFVSELEESFDPKTLLYTALKTAVNADYLDSDGASSAIVAAAYVDTQFNKTKYSSDGENEQLDIDSFPERFPNIDLSDLRQIAVAALNKVLGDDSELKQLWEENETDFPRWRQTIKDLIKRLT